MRFKRNYKTAVFCYALCHGPTGCFSHHQREAGMDPMLEALTAAVLRNVFPAEVAGVGEAQLYRAISADVVLTQPDRGRPLDLHAFITLLTLAAPFVPLIVEIIKAMKPEERRSVEKLTQTVLILVADRPESQQLQELRPQALEHLVTKCVDTVLKNLGRL